MEESRKENGDALPKPSTGLDVREIYLAKRGLSVVPDLSTFSQLRYVWLNDNRIKIIQSNMFNCCIAELYLHNNDITSVSGGLRHLTCLRVLLLHNNQLQNLEETVAELRNMQCLQTVNFFLNPFTQDAEYRHYVIHHLPSVQVLDRKEVRREERTHAFRLFSPERQRTLDTIAFSRRALTPPVGRKVTSDAYKPRGPRGTRNRHKIHSSDTETENPSECRSMPRSNIQFSIMDWCSMRSVQQSPLEEGSSTTANILTIKFK